MTRKKFLDIYQYAAGGIVLLLALVILAGWHLGLQSLVQFRAGMVPMQHNTALAHGLGALALLTARGAGRLRWLSMAAAALVMALAGVTGFQYLVSSNFGIDTFFVDPYMQAGSHLQVRTAYPGRMAPNTVICFMLVSAALLCWHWIARVTARLNATLVFAALAATLSSIALSGYLLNLEAAYGWWSLSDMAPQTATGFFLISLGIIALVFRQDVGGDLREEWLSARRPLLAAIAGIVITLIIAQGALEQGRRKTEQLIDAETVRVAGLIEHDLNAGIKALERMQARWKIRGGTPPDQWREDAKLYMQDRQFYYALALVDQDFKVYASVPPETDGEFWAHVDIDETLLAKAEGERQDVLVNRLTRDGKITDLLGFYLPLYASGRFDGFLAVAYSVRDGVAKLLDINKSDYQYEIYDRDNLLFANFVPEHAFSWGVSRESDIDAEGVSLRIKATKDVSGYESGGIVFLIFIAGVGMSLLLASSMHKTNKIHREVSERMQAESSVKTYQARLEAVVDTMVDGIITIDERGIVQSYNKACEKMFGYKSDEVIGNNVKMIMPSQYADHHDQYLKNYVRTGEAKIIGTGREVEGQRKDGSVFPVDLAVSEVAHQGERMFSGIVRDITERKEYEAQLRRTNEELEQFAYIASHDLKAPLRGIDNLTKWIEEDLQSVITDDAREKLDMMRGRVSRLESLLEDILQYSRAGRIVDEPVEIDTKDMVAQIVDSLDLPGGFHVDVADDMPVLTAPYTPLHQVFLNLLSNAYKHHDRKEGSIAVSVKDAGSFYQFSVADDGPGIPEEFHERVFKMFQTLQSRDKKEGSGLGMSIIKKLVEWQGGRVWIESKAGRRGTEVCFLWPRSFVNVRRKDAA